MLREYPLTLIVLSTLKSKLKFHGVVEFPIDSNGERERGSPSFKIAPSFGPP